ncbi:Protein GrpE 2, partial [Bienertia sinuspersici]
TYIAPGKIGSTRVQGFKAPFLPGVFSKENHSASNDVPHMSNANDGSINKAPRKEVNPLHTSLIESLNEDVHEDDMLQRSINNDALSRFIDQSASEGDLSMHEEETTNKFAGKGLPLDRTTIIDHMKRLWHNWRGILSQNSIKKKGGPENALKETPNDLTPDDWEWLVKEHFSSDKFKGVKEGKDPPPISAVFKRTRQGKSGKLAETEAAKYDEIVAVEKDYPSLSTFEVVEKCFGDQDRGSVVCFGSGVRPKDVRGPLPSRFELTTRLHEKEKENDDLKKRIDEMEKAHQVEREANARKINSLDEKLEFLMNAYMQQSNGGDNTN